MKTYPSLFARPTPEVVRQRRRNREQPIEVLGRLGWTVYEVARAIGVTPPTVRSSVAYLTLVEEGRFRRSRPLPLSLKISASQNKLASLLMLRGRERRRNGAVCDALRAVLANVPKSPSVV